MELKVSQANSANRTVLVPVVVGVLEIDVVADDVCDVVGDCVAVVVADVETVDVAEDVGVPVCVEGGVVVCELVAVTVCEVVEHREGSCAELRTKCRLEMAERVAPDPSPK